MPTNKHASIRYQTLDKCFSNFGRRFFIEDLVDACCDALYEFEGIKDGVKKRQVQDDIRYMKSEQGWDIPLETHKEGKRTYYRYENKNFSINSRGLNTTEIEQLTDTLAILSRFRGIPQFEWIQEMQVRLKETFGSKNKETAFISFQENLYLKGREYFTDLFNALQNKQSITITYKSFKEENSRIFTFHPWYLKQFNNRWFLFGWNDEENTLSNLAIDRITKIQYTRTPYKPNDKIDFEEYFDDIVGVTVKENEPVESIRLKITPDLWNYIESKPIHGSQKLKNKTDDGIIVEVEVKINYEFMSLLFSYMDGIEVIEPEWIRKEVKEKLEGILRKYS